MYAKDILDIKGSDVVSVKPEETLRDVLQIFSDMKIGFAIVVDVRGGISGTISERDICRTVLELGEKAVRTEVQQVMTQRIVSCTMEDKLPRIMALMTNRRTRHVLVMEGKAARGIVSIGDVVKHRLEEVLRAEESMRDYIEGSGYSYHPRT